jgi:protein-disulfide isomerase
MNKVFIPLSIIISGAIIAGAIILSKNASNVAPEVVDNSGGEELSVRPISDQDHIRGNPDAEILIVEYSDFECPFCGGFHGTMNRIIEEYGDSGQVAWVYRHVPLDQIHADARPAAEASECVAELGGEDKFWEYADHLFANQDTALNKEGLLETAKSIGIDEGAFNTCVGERRYQDRVNADFEDGISISKVDPEFGTPYNILMSKSGIQIPIRGNQPYNVVKQAIDAVLSGEGSN